MLRFPLRLLCLALGLAVCLCLIADVFAAEFAGDLTMASTAQTMTGRLMVKDSVYRMDIAQGDGHFFVIVNQLTNVSYVCNPRTRSYQAIPTKSPASLQNDPFQAARYGDSIGVREYRGQDTIGGLVCDHYVIKLGPNPLMAEWVAQDLDFPIRIENMMARDSAYVAVGNIAVGPVDTLEFAVPADYTIQEERPAKAPGGVKTGEQERRDVDPSLPIEVGLVNFADGESVCVIELFRGGELLPEAEIGPTAQRTFAFSARGAQTRRIYTVAADAVVVRVESGEVAVEIAQPQ